MPPWQVITLFGLGAVQQVLPHAGSPSSQVAPHFLSLQVALPLLPVGAEHL
jgi:hypothetical protein